jgi:hypothetical protein
MESFSNIVNHQLCQHIQQNSSAVTGKFYHKHRNLNYVDIGSKEIMVDPSSKQFSFQTKNSGKSKTGQLLLEHNKKGPLYGTSFDKENSFYLLEKLWKFKVTVPVRYGRKSKTGLHTSILGYPAFLPYEYLNLGKDINYSSKNLDLGMLVTIQDINFSKRYCIIKPCKR